MNKIIDEVLKIKDHCSSILENALKNKPEFSRLLELKRAIYLLDEISKIPSNIKSNLIYLEELSYEHLRSLNQLKSLMEFPQKDNSTLKLLKKKYEKKILLRHKMIKNLKSDVLEQMHFFILKNKALTKNLKPLIYPPINKPLARIKFKESKTIQQSITLVPPNFTQVKILEYLSELFLCLISNNFWQAGVISELFPREIRNHSTRVIKFFERIEALLYNENLVFYPRNSPLNVCQIWFFYSDRKIRAKVDDAFLDSNQSDNDTELKR